MKHLRRLLIRLKLIEPNRLPVYTELNARIAAREPEKFR